MIRGFSAVVAVLAATTAASAEAPPSRTAAFTIGGVAYTMPVPTGFCLPEGQMTAVAETVAKADNVNATHLTLYQCGAIPTKVGDYTLIKTPTTLVSQNVDAAMFAKQLAPEFDKPLPISDEDLSARAADGYDRTTGTRPRIGVKLATHGHDAVCGYMSGGGTVGQGETSKNIALGACMTAIGGRVINVIRYTEYKSPADEQRMMREAKAIALTIKATGTR